MIVKCIKEDEHGHLGLNRTYFVHGIQYINGEMHYCILPYEGIWYWSQFSTKYFQVIDETVPTNWKFGMHKGFFDVLPRLTKRPQPMKIIMEGLWTAIQ